MTHNSIFDQIADHMCGGGNTPTTTDQPAAPLWALLNNVTRLTPAENVYWAAAAIAAELPDDVLGKALTPIDPSILAGDEAQYAAFRQALLDQVHTRALDTASSEGNPIVQTARSTWAGATAEQIALGILAAGGNALRTVPGGER
jgi:hypothetical protein